MELDKEELLQNYEDLHKGTGESYESIAARLEQNAGDKNLAAEIRSRHADKKDAPKQRRSTAAKDTAGGDK